MNQHGRFVRLALAGGMLIALAATAQTPAARLTPWGTGTAAPAPWRLVGLPGGKVPQTQFDVTELDGAQVLRVRSNASYGTLNHPTGPAPGLLSWRWRVDTPVTGADLRRKHADDAPLKLCAMFDLPLEALGFMERSVMRMARSRSAEPLPAATLCYLWDATLPAGTVLPNPYTARVRYFVLDSGAAALGRWQPHRRDLASDFLLAFGHESATVPPLVAIVVGADADNTGGSGLAYLADLQLEPGRGVPTK